jgi:16S rRNA (adenine1518-N6/adenine1519-N6)-dimethyltransferase
VADGRRSWPTGCTSSPRTRCACGAATCPAAPTALVANLPYNVGVPVVLHLLAELPSLRAGLVMVQAEVAERLAAAPGAGVRGAEREARVVRAAAPGRAGAAAVFWPVPNVDSGCWRSAPATRRRATGPRCSPWWTRRSRSAGRSAVALAGWAGSPAAAEDALRAAGIDPTARAERLAITDFARLAAPPPLSEALRTVAPCRRRFDRPAPVGARRRARGLLSSR